MNEDELNELASAYALGSLEGEERARFEGLLRSGDPDAVARLREFEAALVGVAQEIQETPPPSAKRALMARVAAERAPVPPPAERRQPPAGGRRSVWTVVWATAMAAGIAAIAVGLAVSTGYEKRLQRLGEEAAALRQELGSQQAVLAILRDPATQVVALAGQAASPEAKGRMLWNPPAGGLFVAAGLPTLPPGKTYQLWAIAGNAPPVSAGLFTVDASGTGSLRVLPLAGISRVDVFAVTLEPAGGLPAPSGAMYLVGKS